METLDELEQLCALLGLMIPNYNDKAKQILQEKWPNIYNDIYNSDSPETKISEIYLGVKEKTRNLYVEIIDKKFPGSDVPYDAEYHEYPDFSNGYKFDEIYTTFNAFSDIDYLCIQKLPFTIMNRKSYLTKKSYNVHGNILLWFSNKKFGAQTIDYLYENAETNEYLMCVNNMCVILHNKRLIICDGDLVEEN